MRSLALGLSCAVLALSMAGCVDFAHGVAEPPMANDDRLIGYWQVADEQRAISLAIAADGPAGLAITVYEDRSCQKALHLSAARTRIGERDFLDVRLVDDGGRSNIGPYAYQFGTPSELEVFPPDLDGMTQAVGAKELSGKTRRAPNADTIIFTEIDASSAELRQWVETHPAAVRAKQITLSRNDPSMAPHCG